MKTYSVVIMAFANNGGWSWATAYWGQGWVDANDQETAEAAAAKLLLEEFPTDKYTQQRYLVTKVPEPKKRSQPNHDRRP